MLPTIDTTQSILGYRAYETFAFQPGIYTDSTCTWTATGLPSGLSINSSTALISGSVSTPGIYVVGIRGTNSTGAMAAPVYFTIGIEAGDGSESVAGSADTGIDVAIDVCTREVTAGILSGAPASTGPLFLLKEDDTVILNIRFKKNGVALDPDPTEIRLAFKAFEPEAALFSAGGVATTDWAKSGVGANAFFRVPVVATSASLAAALADNEEDAGTKFSALCEIEWKQAISAVGGVTELIASSQTFLVTIERDLVL